MIFGPSVRNSSIDVRMIASFYLTASSEKKDSELHEFDEFINYLGQYSLFRSNALTSDLYISINHNKKLLKAFTNASISKRPRVLIRLEPYCVYPKQYSHKIEALYDLIITPGSVQDFKKGRDFIGFPHSIQPNPSQPSLIYNVHDLNTVINSLDMNLDNWKKRQIFCSMIAANKVSPVRDSNYSLRRTIASKNKDNFLQIYGPLWRSSLKVKVLHRLKVLVFNLRSNTPISITEIYGKLFTSYSWAKGEVMNKYSISQNSKFSLVVENSNGYVSEKLFDAILCGSVPIYIGPKLAKVGIPENLAIELDSLDKLSVSFLETFDDRSIKKYLQEGRNFLLSDTYSNNWQYSSVFKKIAALISSITRA
jgi:hypothetical protein